MRELLGRLCVVQQFTDAGHVRLIGFLSASLAFAALTSSSTVLKATETLAGAGSLDATFDPQINGGVNHVALTAEGKIVIAGVFTSVGGTPRNKIARVETNGVVDPTFVPTIDGSSAVALTVLADGRVILATSLYPALAVPPNAIVALSPSGALEATLDMATVLQAAGFSTNGYATNKLFVQQDGNPILRHFGSVGFSNKVAYFALRLAGNTLSARLTNLGVEPTNLRQSTGKTISLDYEQLSGPPPTYVLLRRDDGQSVDESFRTILGATVSAPPMALQSDDKFLTAPYFINFGPSEITVRRYRADGILDTNFSQIGLLPAFGYASPPVSAIVVEPGGTALVAGGFSSVRTASRGYLIRIHLGPPDPPAIPRVIRQPESRDVLLGETNVLRANLDATGPLQIQWLFKSQPLPHQTNLVLVLTNTVEAHEGDYVIELKNAAGSLQSAPARVTVVPAPGGSVDPAFDPGLGVEDGQVNALLLEPDGRILVGGTFTRFNGVSRLGLVRLNSNGTIDANFEAGRSGLNAPAAAKIKVDVLARQNDGRILFAGTVQAPGVTAQPSVFRLNSDGTLDLSFRALPSSLAMIMSLMPLPDNRVLVGGTFNYTNQSGILFGDTFRNLVRLSETGELDRTYQPQASASQSGSRFSLPGYVRAMELLDDQRLLIGGAFEPRGIGASFARLKPDGSRDVTFQPRVYAPMDELGRGGVPTISAMAMNKNGDSAIAGGFLVAGGQAGIACFSDDGHLKGLNVAVLGVFVLTWQRDGKLLVGGAFDAIGGIARSNLARLHADGSVDLSFGSAGGRPNGAVLAILAEPSDSILIGGNFTAVDGVNRRGVARLYGSGKVYRQFLKPRMNADGLVASIQTLAGKRYVLERSDTFASLTWTTVKTFQGDGNVQEISVGNTGARQGFYRFRIE